MALLAKQKVIGVSRGVLARASQLIGSRFIARVNTCGMVAFGLRLETTESVFVAVQKMVSNEMSNFMAKRTRDRFTECDCRNHLRA